MCCVEGQTCVFFCRCAECDQDSVQAPTFSTSAGTSTAVAMLWRHTEGLSSFLYFSNCALDLQTRYYNQKQRVIKQIYVHEYDHLTYLYRYFTGIIWVCYVKFLTKNKDLGFFCQKATIKNEDKAKIWIKLGKLKDLCDSAIHRGFMWFCILLHYIVHAYLLSTEISCSVSLLNDTAVLFMKACNASSQDKVPQQQLVT